MNRSGSSWTVCERDDCERRAAVRGYCDSHYKTALANGTLTRKRQYPRRPLADRFFEKVQKTDGCWYWTGARNPSGYGHLTGLDHQVRNAHVISYELHVGPVPDGMQIDHLCRVRQCVRPDHLEPVTSRQNTLRGEAPTAVNARKTHCSRGHAFDEENTRPAKPRNGRVCRACNRGWRAEARVKRLAAAVTLGLALLTGCGAPCATHHRSAQCSGQWF